MWRIVSSVASPRSGPIADLGGGAWPGSHRRPFSQRDGGPVTLKSLSEPIRLYEVVWSDVLPTDSAALVAAHSEQRRFAPLACFMAGIAVERLRQAAPLSAADEAAYLRASREAVEAEPGPVA